MCIAIPARVIEKLSSEKALVEQGQIQREVSILPVPDVEIGEYVLLNLGTAVKKLTEAEALEVIDLWAQIGRSMTQDVDSMIFTEQNL